MTRLKVLFGVLVAFCALAAVTAASASATVGPTLLIGTRGSENGTQILLNTGLVTIPSELQSTAATITGRKLELEITLLENKLIIEGTYLAKFYETLKAGNSCSTAGAATGEIEVGAHPRSETILVVYIEDSPSSLMVGETFAVNSLTITCGSQTTTVNGNVLGTINPLNRAIRAGANEIKGALRCSATTGVPELTRYINQNGTGGTAELKVSSGGTNSRGCELIGSTATEVVKLLANKEVELMG